MRGRNIFFVVFFLFSTNYNSIGQSLGFELPKGISRIDIPFQLANNLIVVDITFSQTLSTKFIFDTGAEHTILCKREIADVMRLDYDRTFQIFGADLSTVLSAHLLRHVSLKVKGTYIEAPNQDILVLDDDYLKLDEASGEKISGILGADMFNRYVVKINYIKKVISLYDSKNFAPPSGFESFDIKIKSGKPYFYPTVAISQQDSTPLKILIDTGAALAFLLFTNTHQSLRLPESYIRGSVGNGLGGSIDGFIGRIHLLKLSPKIKFQSLPCDFQDVALIDSTTIGERNGILGQKLLSRFTIYIDYVREKMYLQPNKYYKKALSYDRSGLNLIAVGADLGQFLVRDVTPGSPAAWADFRKDDEILSINHIMADYYALETIAELFSRKANKRYRIVIKRHEHKYIKYLTLKDLI